MTSPLLQSRDSRAEFLLVRDLNRDAVLGDVHASQDASRISAVESERHGEVSAKGPR